LALIDHNEIKRGWPGGGVGNYFFADGVEIRALAFRIPWQFGINVRLKVNATPVVEGGDIFFWETKVAERCLNVVFEDISVDEYSEFIRRYPLGVTKVSGSVEENLSFA
jgi:hypothetical protein